jgi:hypothetical protein
MEIEQLIYKFLYTLDDYSYNRINNEDFQQFFELNFNNNFELHRCYINCDFNLYKLDDFINYLIYTFANILTNENHIPGAIHYLSYNNNNQIITCEHRIVFYGIDKSNNQTISGYNHIIYEMNKINSKWYFSKLNETLVITSTA